MTCLIACLSTGKGTWSEVMNVIKGAEWEDIFLITSPFARENLRIELPVNYIIVDESRPVTELSEHIRRSLEGKVKGLEVALNIASGSGKEHTATLSAILRLGLAVRLVVPGPEGIREV